MSVNRYEFELYHCNGGEMLVSETGDYVSYVDYAALEQKLAESQREFRAADATIENLQMQLNAEREAKLALAAENAGLKDFVKTCFRAAADGASLDGADIQELGERLGLFGRETYQPVLHGYICGHEAGEDTVYVMKKTPATDAFLAEVRAQGVEMFALMFAEEAIKTNNITTGWRAKASRAASEYAEALREDAAQLRKGVQS